MSVAAFKSDQNVEDNEVCPWTVKMTTNGVSLPTTSANHRLSILATSYNIHKLNSQIIKSSNHFAMNQAQ
jgi:hypothetical protein